MMKGEEHVDERKKTFLQLLAQLSEQELAELIRYMAALAADGAK